MSWEVIVSIVTVTGVNVFTLIGISTRLEHRLTRIETNLEVIMRKLGI